MLGKCILSAPTAEDLERLINEYYGLENYRIDGNLVFNRKTMKHLGGVYVVCLRGNGRWQMRRRVKDEES